MVSRATSSLVISTVVAAAAVAVVGGAVVVGTSCSSTSLRAGVDAGADANVGAGGAAATGGAPGSGGESGSGGASASGSGGAGGGVAPGTGGAGGGNSGAGGSFGISGPSRCATAGVALCEGFENGLSSTLWTTRQSGDGTVTVDDLHAARGSKALHVKTASGNGFAYITEKMSFPAPANILYGRMFVWFEDDLTTDGHFSLAEGAGTGTAGVIRFGGQNKFFGVGTDGGASGDWTDKDNRLIPFRTWICAEFQFKGDTNEFHAWWDDVERTALHRGPSQHAGFTMPQFNSLWFGYWMYNMIEPQELWIDEIAVDFSPIGCAR
jgi:hypothetical protein